MASFRLTERLPRGHVFAVVDSGDGKVVLSGETRGTGIGPPPQGAQLDRERLDRFASEVEEVKTGSRRVLWWTYRGQADDFTAPAGASGVVLKGLAQQYGTQVDPPRKLAQRCNGVVAYAYDTARRDGETDPARLYTFSGAALPRNAAYLQVSSMPPNSTPGCGFALLSRKPARTEMYTAPVSTKMPYTVAAHRRRHLGHSAQECPKRPKSAHIPAHSARVVDSTQA